MKTKPLSPMRELVLEAIKRRPYATAARVAEVTGLPFRSVITHLNHLAADEVIHSVRLERKPGMTRSPVSGYRFGLHPDIAAARASAKLIPQQWDVLALFFGRITDVQAA
jgi:predicted ArsR family transcriptional regulator